MYCTEQCMFLRLYLLVSKYHMAVLVLQPKSPDWRKAEVIEARTEFSLARAQTTCYSSWLDYFAYLVL